MRTLRRRLWLWLAVAAVMAPQVALAQESKVPEFNPLCWEKDACLEVRAQNLRKTRQELTEEEKSGWLQDQATCPGEKWGKCLPAGISTTQVSFGGRNKFLHLGDFVQYMYRFAIGIAGVLAAVMMVVAGFQWVSSGGNTEAIQSAKHRITGSVIGLLIAYLSYAILNTLNPALVNLRLPQVFMIRPQSLVPEFCTAAPSTTLFSYAKDPVDQLTPLPKPTTTLNYDLTITGKPLMPAGSPYLNKAFKPETFSCGSRFFLKDGGDSTCYGDVCGKGRVCTDFTNASLTDKQKYSCFPGMLMGYAQGSNIAGTSLIDSSDEIRLLALCKDGSYKQVNKIKIEQQNNETPRYTFPATDEISSICGNEKDVLGFYMGVEVNDEPGEDDWFAVGQAAPGSHVCNTNISKLAFKATQNNQEATCSFVECNCSYFQPEGIRKSLAHKIEIGDPAAANFQNHLISLDELKRGYQCNIVLSRSDFPSQDNKTLERLVYATAGTVIVGATGGSIAIAAGGLGTAAAGTAAVGSAAVTAGEAIALSSAAGIGAITANSGAIIVEGTIAATPWYLSSATIFGGGSFLGAIGGLSLADPTSCCSGVTGAWCN